MIDTARWGATSLADRAILEAANELGWITATGFGAAPLTYEEIKAYADVTDQIEYSDITTVRAVSIAYAEGISVRPKTALDCDPALWVKYAGVIQPLVDPASVDAVKIAITHHE